jgi:predicted secreted Zn-dependent protease
MELRLLPLLALTFALSACIATAGRAVTAEPPAHLVLVSSTTETGTRVRLNQTISKSFYAVAGDSAEALRRSLDAAQGGFDAETEWSMTWTFRYRRGPASCELDAANVDLAIVVRLPRSDDEAAFAPDLRQRWDDYVRALEAHEMGHAEREAAVARAYAAALEDVAGDSDCGRLGSVLNALGQSYLDQGRASDAAYDAATGHGATEGATFP